MLYTPLQLTNYERYEENLHGIQRRTSIQRRRRSPKRPHQENTRLCRYGKSYISREGKGPHLGGLLKADKENNGGYEMNSFGGLEYYHKLEEEYPSLIMAEIDHFLRELSISLKKHCHINLLKDDRGALADEAVCKWVYLSIKENGCLYDEVKK